ncbi:MAG: hydrogenase maturation protease [Bryobacteraceae bacterium]
MNGRTVVLGLGNPVVSDDRVGLEVARQLASLLELAPVAAVDVRTSTRGGFDLLDLLSGYGRAILVDCLAVPHPIPGTIRRLRLDDVAGSARLINAHGLGLADVFLLAERLGIPMPEKLEIYAVEAADTSTLSEEMTPAVRDAASLLARDLHELLRNQSR